MPEINGKISADTGNRPPDDSLQRFLLDAEKEAYPGFRQLLDRSIDTIVQKVSDLKLQHPGHYEADLARIARGEGAELTDLRKSLIRLFESLVERHKEHPTVIDYRSRGETLSLSGIFSPKIGYDVGFEIDGGYSVGLRFNAPSASTDPGDAVRSHQFLLLHGHCFSVKGYADLNQPRTWETLTAVDGAPPFLSHFNLREMSKSTMVERAYFVGFTNFLIPAGAPGRFFDGYYIVELPGTDLGQKLQGAQQILSTSNPKIPTNVHAALPEGFRFAGKVCAGLGNSAGQGNSGPVGNDFFDLVKRGMPNEWYTLQSYANPTFNDKPAYVFVRRGSEQVAQLEMPTALAVVGGSPKKISGSLCLRADGGFEPPGVFGRLIEDTSIPPRFDSALWQLRDHEDLP